MAPREGARRRAGVECDDEQATSKQSQHHLCLLQPKPQTSLYPAGSHHYLLLHALCEGLAKREWHLEPQALDFWPLRPVLVVHLLLASLSDHLRLASCCRTCRRRSRLMSDKQAFGRSAATGLTNAISWGPFDGQHRRRAGLSVLEVGDQFLEPLMLVAANLPGTSECQSCVPSLSSAWLRDFAEERCLRQSLPS